MKLIYFSGTGQTKMVVEWLGNEFHEKKEEIDLLQVNFLDTHIDKDELCIIGVPSFGGRVPTIALERMQHIQASHSPAILVVTYGNRAYDDTLLELKNQAIASGFQPLAAITCVCEHSIVHQYAKDRPNQKDKEELIGYAQTIKANLNNQLSYVPGHYPYIPYHIGALSFELKDSCNKCGLCVQQCPTQAIDIHCLDHVDETKCISCMHCIYICPQKAREYSSEQLNLLMKKLDKVCRVDKKNELFL